MIRSIVGLFGKFYHRALLLGQTLFRVDKFKKLNIDLEIYAGANWVDLPRDAASYCINYLESHPNLQKNVTNRVLLR